MGRKEDIMVGQKKEVSGDIKKVMKICKNYIEEKGKSVKKGYHIYIGLSKVIVGLNSSPGLVMCD